MTRGFRGHPPRVSTPTAGASRETTERRAGRARERSSVDVDRSDARLTIVMRGDRAPLLPKRRGDAFGTSGSGRDDESTREARASAAVSRTVMSRANAVCERVRDVIGACEAEEVSETRTRRVRVATASLAIGALALCGVGSASTTVGTAPATMVKGESGVRAFAALGDAASVGWTKDFVDDRELDLRELDFGEYARGARVADPDRTGGLSKRWAKEYEDVMQPQMKYDRHFSGMKPGMKPTIHAPGHYRRAQIGATDERPPVEERAPAQQSNDNVESASPKPVQEADVGMAPTYSQSADATESFVGEIIGDVAAEHPKQYSDAPDLGHGAKGELSIDDLLIDADDAFKVSSGSKSHSSSSKPRSSSSKSRSSKSNDSKSSKSHPRSVSKGSSKSKLRAPEHGKSKSPLDKLKSMVFNEMSFGKKSKNSKFEDALNAHHHRMSSRGLSSKGRGKLRQYPYPHHKHDIDQNDANDVEVFYKKKDLLDLGEYDQETIDDFKYGRGLVPRDDHQRLHGITVDTNADVSTFDGDNYPGGHSGSTNGEEDMDSLMASLSVSAKDAKKHATERRKDQKANSKLKKRVTPKKPSTQLKGSDWSEGPKSRKASTSAPKAKKSTGGVLSRDDWSGKAPVAASKAKSQKKTAGKSFKSISWSDSPASEEKKSTPTSKKKKSPSSSSDSKTKVGKMSRETAAKYLSKVKGHNEETHRKLRRTAPKLGAVEMEEDDLYDEPIAESSSLGGHSRRHETIAKVVEAATVQNAQSENSQAPELGKKHSPHFQSASNEELRKGGAWRDVFPKMIGGRKSYEQIRRQIFGRDASQTDH